MSSPARIILLGTGDFALPTFLHLVETGHQVVTLVTQPDRPQGRKQERIPSRIKRAAMARDIPVFQPEDVNAPESLEAIRALEPDVLVTAAYGQILSADLLAIPKLGGLNLHGSILPAYRGAAPVARAIERGETETGVTVILMNPRVDAGGIIQVATTPIDPDETAGELEDRLALLGAPLVADTLTALSAGTARVQPQERAKVTKAAKLRKEDGLIDWSKPARAVHDQVRAMQPWPIATTYWHRRYHPDLEPLRLIIHRTRPVDGPDAERPAPGTVVEAAGDRLVVAAAVGWVRVLTVQVAGKKPMPAADFLRGHLVLPGDRFGSADPAATG
jgi:methionyl-tRNA formyltransferase